MTTRPIFAPSFTGNKFVTKYDTEFLWHAGFSVSQKQKSIKSLHEQGKIQFNLNNILEVSTKSMLKVGKQASAFNLSIETKDGIRTTVESLYQGSKVFENGGPYRDIYSLSSLDAKKDSRLKNSGNLIQFKFIDNSIWQLNENFYDWIYLNALLQNQQIAEELMLYEAFTDIEFNPKKSFNCQAYSVALYKSLLKRNQDFEEIKDPNKFKKIFPTNLIFIQDQIF